MERNETGWDKRQNIRNTAGFRSNQQNFDLTSRQILLKLHAFIERDKYIKFALS